MSVTDPQNLGDMIALARDRLDDIDEGTPEDRQ